MSDKKAAHKRASTAAWLANRDRERREALQRKAEQDARMNAGLANRGLFRVRLQSLEDELEAIQFGRPSDGGGNMPVADPALAEWSSAS